MNRIRIAYSIACFLFHEARQLVMHGTGRNIYGTEVGLPAILDQMPLGTEEARFADACMAFIRYVAIILATALEEDRENLDPGDSFGDIFEDNNSQNEI